VPEHNELGKANANKIIPSSRSQNGAQKRLRFQKTGSLFAESSQRLKVRREGKRCDGEGEQGPALGGPRIERPRAPDPPKFCGCEDDPNWVHRFSEMRKGGEELIITVAVA